MSKLKIRIYELITFANGLISLVEAQRSFDIAKASRDAMKASLDAAKASANAATASLAEEKAVRALTIVGMLYLPLEFTAGLFSMGQDYGPGQSRFWVYWVVAVPSVCLASVMYIFVVKVMLSGAMDGKWKMSGSSNNGDRHASTP